MGTVKQENEITCMCLRYNTQLVRELHIPQEGGEEVKRNQIIKFKKIGC